MDTFTLTKDQFDILVKQGVEQATALLQQQLAETQAGLDAVKRNRDDVLAEKKALEGKKPVPDHVIDRVMADADAVLRNVGIGRPVRSAATFELSREDARDPAKWRAAKEAAAKAGKSGPVVFDPDAQPAATINSVAEVVRTGRTIYVRQDQYRDPTIYRRLREEATRDRKDLRAFTDRAALAAVSDGDTDALTYFDRIASGDGSKIVRENEA